MLFRSCKTVCLTLGSRFAQLQAALAQDNPGVQLLSISFDGGHDTPNILRHYARPLGADPAIWRFARVADPTEQAALLRQLGVVVIPDGFGDYEHNAALLVFDAQGRMVTSSGLPVVNGITIPANATKVSISADGVVSATIPGNAQPQQVGNLAMSTFINPAGLEPVGQNMYKESAASGQPQQGTPGTNGLGYIKQGFLEASNVNVVEELVSMIQTQRAYEMNSKAISTSDQMLAKLSQL